VSCGLRILEVQHKVLQKFGKLSRKGHIAVSSEQKLSAAGYGSEKYSFFKQNRPYIAFKQSMVGLLCHSLSCIVIIFCTFGLYGFTKRYRPLFQERKNIKHQLY
ncbi:MAG: hypothetical protein J6M17_04035, partial [Ruminococcus sp.]|nr:hypothetical protein [Ruminococcus sp.]